MLRDRLVVFINNKPLSNLICETDTLLKWIAKNRRKVGINTRLF